MTHASNTMEDRQADKPLLELKALSKTFIGGVGTNGKRIRVKALKNVSFTIYPGEFIAVLGVSGSGKSTLLHCLSAFEKPDQNSTASIRYQHKQINSNIWDNPDWYRQNFIGTLFQSCHLLDKLSVRGNVELPLKLKYCEAFIPDRKGRLKAVSKVLQRLAVEHCLHNQIKQLSSNQCQRVAIAQALIKNPQLLLADEPAGNLDEANKKAIIKELKTLAQSGVAVLMVTQNRQYIEAYADRILTLKEGQLFSEENVNTVVTQQNPTPKKPATPSADHVQLDIAGKIRPSHPSNQVLNKQQQKKTDPLPVKSEQITTSKESKANQAEQSTWNSLETTRRLPAATANQVSHLPTANMDTTTQRMPSSKIANKTSATPAADDTVSYHAKAVATIKQNKSKPHTAKLFASLRLPGCHLNLIDLLVFAMKDAKENAISLVSNVIAILFGSVLTALLISLLMGTERYINHLWPMIPGINSVHVDVDYSVKEPPLTRAEMQQLKQWPEADMVIPDIHQFAPLLVKKNQEIIVTLASSLPGDPQTEHLKLLKGTKTLDPEAWDILLSKRMAAEIDPFEPMALAGKQITLLLRRYEKTANIDQAKIITELDFPVRVVGIVASSLNEQVYGSLNMLRFVRDFSTGRSNYIPQAEAVIDLTRISKRTLNESVRLHFGSPGKAETAFVKIKETLGERLDIYWSGSEMLYLRDVQTVAFIVLACIALLTIIAGSISIFNTLNASIAQKNRQIGIQFGLGFSRMDILLIYIWQALLIGLLTGVLGLFITRLTVNYLNAQVIEQWHELQEAMAETGGLFFINNTVGLVMLGTVLLICLAAAFIPAWTASRKTPMDALK